MEIDNFKNIIPLLKFSDPDSFYFLQLIQRKKDKGRFKIKGTNNNSRLFKAYFVNNNEYLLEREEEIKELCRLTGARAMIHLTPRSYEKVALNSLKLMTDNLINKNFNKIHKVYTSSCGRVDKGKRKWIIDIDENDFNFEPLERFIEEECRPEGEKIITKIPSKNGYHLITRPYELNKFKKEFPEIEVHKNNPTNLFIP